MILSCTWWCVFRLSSSLQCFELAIIINISKATHSVAELGFEPPLWTPRTTFPFTRPALSLDHFLSPEQRLAMRHIQGCRRSQSCLKGIKQGSWTRKITSHFIWIPCRSLFYRVYKVAIKDNGENKDNSFSQRHWSSVEVYFLSLFGTKWGICSVFLIYIKYTIQFDTLSAPCT